MTKHRKSFQFTVRGDRQAGVIYVTRSFVVDDEAKALAAAVRIAARRSGDPSPTFIRTVPPVR
jgi:hypothetical protein